MVRKNSHCFGGRGTRASETPTAMKRTADRNQIIRPQTSLNALLQWGLSDAGNIVGLRLAYYIIGLNI